MIEQPDIVLLLRLLTAHVIADFLMQPISWINSKNKMGVRSPALYYHVGIVGLMTYLFLYDWGNLWLPLFIIITHWAIDWWKSSRPETTRYFLIDQAAHLLMILIAWALYTGNAPALYTVPAWLIPAAPAGFWIILISYLMVIWPFGFLIAIITRRWRHELHADTPKQPGADPEKNFFGLKNAGMWIGCLERFLILTFVLLNQFGAIGFLIAAKSVFRFSGGTKDNRSRKEAEYILIGTLLSFALAITVGFAARYLLQNQLV